MKDFEVGRIRSFLKLTVARFVGDEPTSGAALTYDSMLAIYRSLSNARRVRNTRTDLRDRLKKQRLTGASGLVDYSENGNTLRSVFVIHPEKDNFLVERVWNEK